MWVRVMNVTHWEGERPKCHTSGSVQRCAVLLLSERDDIPHQFLLAPASIAYRWRSSHMHACVAKRHLITNHTYTLSYSHHSPFSYAKVKQSIRHGPVCLLHKVAHSKKILSSRQALHRFLDMWKTCWMRMAVLMKH